VAPVEVRTLTREGSIHRLVLDDGQVVLGRTVLIATGATYQRLPVAGCERWDGSGIYYSCTSVHARSCKDGRAVVIGGGNSAGQAATFLAEHTAGVSLLLRGGDLRKSMSDYLARRIERHPKIELISHVEAAEIHGDRAIHGLRLRNVRDGSTRDLDCQAVFVFIGAQPRTDWLPPSIAVDPKGFILTGADAAHSGRWPLTDREPCAVESTCPGIFAAGDVRSNTTKRVAFAVGDGALAVTCAHRVLEGL
jgi:thioredoxin reductase (NADPH)